jgi:DMSO/TMAO reductase YedYZ molybdopterin-dependent catalytic subunit
MSTETRVAEQPSDRPPPRRHPLVLGAMTGLLTAAAALAVAELASAVVGELSSPVVAVGEAAIDLAPAWLKDFAIRTFGTHDKTALLAGIGVLLVLFAMALGILALRRPVVGYVGLLAFGAVGALAAVTLPTAATLSWVPAALGVAAGAWVLGLLLRAAGGGRPKPVDRPDLYDRRRFLVIGAAVAAGTLTAGALSRIVGRSTARAVASRADVRVPPPADAAPVLPGTGLGTPGLSPFYTPNADFYRVDTAIIVPKVTAEGWRLRIHGMVDREIELSYAELLARPLIERDITLTCVSNVVGGPYVGNARWIGAALAPLLREAGVDPGASQLASTSADGFTVGTPTAVVLDGRDAMLAVAMNGQPLPLAHGFPVRMVVPGLYGYVSATKWVVDLELTTFEAFDAYWVQRGWARQAPIKTMSRIDTPRSGARVPAGRVAVAGVAWAQHRGITAVEVRIDAGAWQPARLTAQDTIDTWRQWVFAWPADPGEHVIQARATDDTGYTQTGTREPPVPDGATGWHTIGVTAV